jgi:hypothetical protein
MIHPTCYKQANAPVTQFILLARGGLVREGVADLLVRQAVTHAWRAGSGRAYGARAKCDWHWV